MVQGLVRREVHGRQLVLTVREFTDATAAEVRRSSPRAVEVLDLALEEIFVETLKAGRVETEDKEAPHA